MVIIKEGVEHVHHRLLLFLLNRVIDLGFDRKEIADVIERMAEEQGVDETAAEAFREIASAYRADRWPPLQVIDGDKPD